MAEIRYVTDPFEEEGEGGGRKPPKKLFGKTDLQRDALAATGRTTYGFRDNAQLKRFTDLEAFAVGADSDSRVWYAWIAYRIAETKRLNTGAIKVNMDALIYRIGMKDKREAWMNDNREKVLAKKSAAEVAGTLDVQTGVDEMERAMARKKRE